MLARLGAVEGLRGPMTEKAEIAALRRELKRQRTMILRLARALHKHARTDLAPDAALPELARLVEDAKG